MFFKSSSNLGFLSEHDLLLKPPPPFLYHALKEIEILALLPVGGVLARVLGAGFLEPGCEAPGRVAVELEEIVDEHVAKLTAEQRLALERVERRRQALRQRRTVGGVRLVALRAGITLVGDPVKAGHDLRRDEEIRIGG